MMDAGLLGRLRLRIESYKEEIIELQRRMTALPAIAPESGGEGEWAKAEYLTSYLRREGFAVERFDSPDSRTPSGLRPNIIARLSGMDRSKTTWVMGHMDIVPPGDLSMWKNDPYSMWTEGNRLFGRGVSDNQSGVIAAIFALKCLKDEGLIPAYDAAAVLVADEETGSKYGVQYLLEQEGLFHSGDRMYIPDAGNEDGSMIEVAEKAKIWVKFTVIGKQGHAGSPNSGINANRAASDLIVRLNRLYQEFNEIDPLFESPSSFEPTKREANVPSINILPGKDVFYMDCRFLPCYTADMILTSIRQINAEIEAEYKVHVQIDYPRETGALPPVGVDSDPVVTLIPAIREVCGVEPRPMGIGGGTVAYYFRLKGIPAVVWMKSGGSAHQPNESVDLDEMMVNAAVFALVMMTDQS
jgi:succinyl-diaminopimelate desuccinylase